MMKKLLFYTFFLINITIIKVESKSSNQVMYDFFTGGLNRLLWNEILFNSTDCTSIVSPSCSKTLTYVKEQFDKGSLLPYKCK